MATHEVIWPTRKIPLCPYLAELMSRVNMHLTSIGLRSLPVSCNTNRNHNIAFDFLNVLLFIDKTTLRIKPQENMLIPHRSHNLIHTCRL